MQPLAEEKKGELYLFTHTFLWAFFPIVAILSFSTLPSLVSFAWNCVVAALFFVCVVAYKNRWAELKNWQLFKYVLCITAFTSIAFYGLYFIGLEYTTAGNAAIIGQFEVLTSFVFFNLLRKERFSLDYTIGAICMILGACIVLAPNFARVNIGDFIIFGSTVLAPLGNLFQQKARRLASSESILFLRYILSVPVIFLLTYTLGKSATLSDVQSVLPFLIINGAFILGLSKMFWVEAIHRISVTKAMALNSLTPLLTLIFAWLILGETPTMWQLAALVPIVVGIAFLTDQIHLRRMVQ